MFPDVFELCEYVHGVAKLPCIIFVEPSHCVWEEKGNLVPFGDIVLNYRLWLNPKCNILLSPLCRNILLSSFWLEIVKYYSPKIHLQNSIALLKVERDLSVYSKIRYWIFLGQYLKAFFVPALPWGNLIILAQQQFTQTLENRRL